MTFDLIRPTGSVLVERLKMWGLRLSNFSFFGTQESFLKKTIWLPHDDPSEVLRQTKIFAQIVKVLVQIVNVLGHVGKVLQ